jgi:hypothetical protein
LLVRTLANPEDPTDLKAANAIQDAIKVEQASAGQFEVPNCMPRADFIFDATRRTARAQHQPRKQS